MDSITGSSTGGDPGAHGEPPAAAPGYEKDDKPVVMGAVVCASLIGLALIVSIVLIVVFTRRWNSQAREQRKELRRRLAMMEEAAAELQRQASWPSDPTSTEAATAEDVPTQPDAVIDGMSTAISANVPSSGTKSPKPRSQTPLLSETASPSPKSHIVKPVEQQVEMMAQTSNAGAPLVVTSPTVTNIGQKSVSVNVPSVSINAVGDQGMQSVRSQSIQVVVE